MILLALLFLALAQEPESPPLNERLADLSERMRDVADDLDEDAAEAEPIEEQGPQLGDTGLLPPEVEEVTDEQCSVEPDPEPVSDPE